MELVLQRLTKGLTRTPGELRVNGVFFCYTVEDRVREVSGRPVREWKVDGETAITAGRYLLTLETSPRFGPETMTINGVDGFSGIRIHGGNDERHTEGCPLVGYELTGAGTIAVGQTKAAVANLKRNVREAAARGDRVFIDVRNPA